MITGQPATRASPHTQWSSRRPGQLGDKKSERRVSEATINQRPPLPPPGISGRSQSLDGLLDDSASCAGVEDDEGASDVVDGLAVGVGLKGMEARSLEVLLDENEDKKKPLDTEMKAIRPPRREERSKSVDNYLGDREDSVRFDSLPRTRSPSEKFCASEMLVVDEAKEIVIVPPTADLDEDYNSEEEGPRVVVEEPKESSEERSIHSTTPSTAMSRQNSSTSSELPERKKTFINRLGKRVRSIIKK